MRLQKFATVLVLTVAMSMLPPAAIGQTDADEVSRVELRELLVKITELLDRSGSRTEAAAKLRQQLDSLDPQAFESLYKFSRNWKKLRIAVALMSEGAARSAEAESTKSWAVRDSRDSVVAAVPLVSPAGLPADLFATAYPVGSNYSTFRATLPGLGAMIDTPGSVPGLNDERCDANFEAGVAIASATFAFANIIAEVVCEALPELADIPCWIAQGVLQVAGEATNTVAAQCAIVDGAVDASEIEAGYENTVAIYKNLDAHHLALKAHDASLTSHNTTLVNHNTNLNFHANDIKTRLALHDTEIKALLATLQGAVNENNQRLKSAQAVQRAIIRLLLTPEGRREVDPAVLTCTGDNCPSVLRCPGPECAFPIKP